jgi:hypothetical protein
VTIFRATKFEGYLQEARRMATKTASEKEARTCSQCGEVHLWRGKERLEPCPREKV